MKGGTMTLDLTPFRAFSVGFDDLFDELRNFKTVGYPPYNIEKMSDGIYNISMAVAGFSKDDLTISVKENVLKIKGKKESKRKIIFTKVLVKGLLNNHLN